MNELQPRTILKLGIPISVGANIIAIAPYAWMADAGELVDFSTFVAIGTLLSMFLTLPVMIGIALVARRMKRCKDGGREMSGLWQAWFICFGVSGSGIALLAGLVAPRDPTFLVLFSSLVVSNFIAVGSVLLILISIRIAIHFVCKGTRAGR